MKHNIFGFLQYLGTPYNLKKLPGALQVLSFILTSVLSLWITLIYSRPSFKRKGDWYVFMVVVLLRFTDALATVIFSAKNLRPGHPLIAIVGQLQEMISSSDRTNHTTWCYILLIATLPNFCLIIYQEWWGTGRSIPAFFDLVKEMTLMMYSAQVLVPYHAIASMLSQIRARMEAYSRGSNYNLTKGVLKLIAIERRLGHIFNELTVEYGMDLVGLIYISMGRIVQSICGVSIVLFSERQKIHTIFLSRFLSELITGITMIWSLAHSAQLVKDQVEKFHSELYTVCLEDVQAKLAQNDLLSIFLERGLSHFSLTANGFFPLDHSLFYRVVSASVTCVFFIIQFRLRGTCYS